jgi:hypothetical protein
LEEPDGRGALFTFPAEANEMRGSCHPIMTHVFGLVTDARHATSFENDKTTLTSFSLHTTMNEILFSSWLNQLRCPHR